MRKIKQILAFAHNVLRYVKSGKRKLKQAILTAWRFLTLTKIERMFYGYVKDVGRSKNRDWTDVMPMLERHGLNHLSFDELVYHYNCYLRKFRGGSRVIWKSRQIDQM